MAGMQRHSQGAKVTRNSSVLVRSWAFGCESCCFVLLRVACCAQCPSGIAAWAGNSAAPVGRGRCCRLAVLLPGARRLELRLRTTSRPWLASLARKVQF